MIAALFMVAQSVIIFAAIYVLFYVPKGKADPLIMQILLEILKMDFQIILFGLGFVTIEQAGNVATEYFKSKVAAIAKAKEKDDDDDVPVAKIPLKTD